MIKHRYDKIIKYSYEKLTGKVLWKHSYRKAEFV
jgi:hypothetical protein